jgi:integrase
MIDVDKPGPDHQERERVLDPSELREVWQASESCGYPLAPFMKLLILTGTRRGEAARARWRDIDLETALWRIPPEHSKSSREHLVALSTAAVRFLKSLPRFTDGDFVFTSRSGRIPINGFSKSKERIDAVISARRKEAGNKKTIEPWTMHDIRRSVATLLAKRGIPPHVLSAILGHTAPGAVTASPILKLYNRHQYLDESRAALEAWSEYVLTLTEPIQAECAHA